MVHPWLEFADLDSPSDPYAEYAIDSATYILWALSGRKYNGVGEITEQYVCPEYDLPAGCSWTDSNRFRNPSTGVYGYVLDHYLYSTSQTYGTRFRLRQQPVRKISSVSISGSALSSASYYIRNSSELVLANGACSSLCEGPTVTYKYGVPPPSSGKLAAIELANELILSYAGSSECSLPERVTDIQRQGLSITMFDPEIFLDKGRLGIYKADLFISAANPGKALKPAKVFSPDMPRGFTRR